MKLSKRGEYALRALIDIGIAHELGRPLVQIGELAEKENLPIKFLEQILMQLKEARYIDSKRGKFGGYYLLMPAAKIKFGQVIRLIDGPLAPVACVSHTAYERCSCPDEEHCGLRMLMEDVRNAIANILDRFTLADTVAMTLNKIRCNNPKIPFIESLLGRPPTERLTSTVTQQIPAIPEVPGSLSLGPDASDLPPALPPPVTSRPPRKRPFGSGAARRKPAAAKAEGTPDKSPDKADKPGNSDGNARLFP